MGDAVPTPLLTVCALCLSLSFLVCEGPALPCLPWGTAVLIKGDPTLEDALELPSDVQTPWKAFTRWAEDWARQWKPPGRRLSTWSQCSLLDHCDQVSPRWGSVCSRTNPVQGSKGCLAGAPATSAQRAECWPGFLGSVTSQSHLLDPWFLHLENRHNHTLYSKLLLICDH